MSFTRNMTLIRVNVGLGGELHLYLTYSIPAIASRLTDAQDRVNPALVPHLPFRREDKPDPSPFLILQSHSFPSIHNLPLIPFPLSTCLVSLTTTSPLSHDTVLDSSLHGGGSYAKPWSKDRAFSLLCSKPKLLYNDLEIRTFQMSILLVNYGVTLHQWWHLSVLYWNVIATSKLAPSPLR